jgi:AbrB family looped-hinge helix DNA binding protein
VSTGIDKLSAGQHLWFIFFMSHIRHVTIGEGGRLVLPASVRSELALTPGTRMLLRTEDDGPLLLWPYRAVAHRALSLGRSRRCLAQRCSGSRLRQPGTA